MILDSEQLDSLISVVIARLDKDRLEDCFAKAEKSYVGFLNPYRFIKAKIRLPNDEAITNENAKQILYDLLHDRGNLFYGQKNDKQSLKFHVVKQLLDINAETDQDAEGMIRKTIEALQKSVGFENVLTRLSKK